MAYDHPKPSGDASSCGPDFSGSTYNRGPTDTNSCMFDFERKQAEAIAARCGKATSPQSGMEMSDTNGIPGQR